MFSILFLLIVFLLLYIFVIRTWSYFSDRNVKFERGLPVLGSLSSVLLGRKNVTEELARIYNKYPNDRYVGMYEIGGKPSVMIRDPELVKAITIKDFDSFVNHSLHVDDAQDPLIGRIMIFTRDQKWRDMRSVFSPLFTGSKIRMMLTLMADSLDEIASYIRREITKKNPTEGSLEYDMTDLLRATASDSIASCAFGIPTNALSGANSEIYKAGKKMAYAFSSGKLFLTAVMPRLARILGLSVISKEHNEFFREIVRNNIQQRKEQNIVRNDMIHLMFLAQHGQLDLKEKEELADAGFATISEEITARSAMKLRDLTEDDYVAQCLVFYVAGFTTMATMMSLLCHELAMQIDIQERLRQEIDETHSSLNGGKVTYEALQRMQYMDQVISELLRLWPSAIFVDRRVSKQYVLDNTDGSKMILQPGDMLWFPVFAIHRDPKYYPNPDKFDPDRFSAENRKSINRATYIPFGSGPRACAASRFALMEFKATIYYLLLNFHMEPSEKTDVSLKMKPGAFSLEPLKGFWLALKIRSK